MPQWKLEGSAVIEVIGGVDGGTPEAEAELFDPSDHNIDEVKAYVKDHPEDVQRVYDVEVDGKGRQTLLDWLTAD